MGKLVPVFLLATAVIILLCFGVLCYLMKSVNPKPIPENARRHSSQIIPFTEELQQGGNLDYGLEKLPENFTVNESITAIVTPVWPNGINNSEIIQNITSKNKTAEILSNIKGQRRSIKYDDEYVDLIKIPNSIILNLRNYNGPKITIQLGTGNNNKRGRKRRSGRKKSDYDKTVVILEVNESILLNVMGNTEDETETNVSKNEFSFESTTFNNLTEDMTNNVINSTVPEDMINNVINSTVPEDIINSDASSFSTTMLSNDITETEYQTDSIKSDATFISTENYTFKDSTDIASTIEVDKTTTGMNDPVVDLLMQGETLKDNPPRNKNMYEIANVS